MSVEITIKRSKSKLQPPKIENHFEKLYHEREYFREKTVIITIRMPKDLLERLDKYCREKHISRSKAVRDAVKRLIKYE